MVSSALAPFPFRSLSVLAPLSLRFYGTEREWSRTGEGQEEDCRGTREEQEEEQVHNGTDPNVHSSVFVFSLPGNILLPAWESKIP